jgi:hypothetical protein
MCASRAELDRAGRSEYSWECGPELEQPWMLRPLCSFSQESSRRRPDAWLQQLHRALTIDSTLDHFSNLSCQVLLQL